MNPDLDPRQKLIEALRMDRSAEPPARPRYGWMWFGALLLAALSSLLTWYLTRANLPATRPAAARDATALESATPISRDVIPSASLLEYQGYVVARRVSTFSSLSPGRLTAVYIEEGQQVRKGAVVARLDDAETRVGLDQARAQLAARQAALRQAETRATDARLKLTRGEQLMASGFISAQDLETLQVTRDNTLADRDSTASGLRSAELQVTEGERRLRETVVYAPLSGIVTRKNAQVGEFVSPGGFTGTSIGTIVDMESLEVEVDVSESFIHRVQPGQQATVKLNAYPDWEIPAAVIAVVPTADKAKQTIKVRIAFKLRDARILPDMSARVAIRADLLDSASATPAADR